MIILKKTGGGMTYVSPFIGPTNHPMDLYISVNSLTTKEVDMDGKIKPGVVFLETGLRPVGGAGEYAYGVTIEAEHIVAENPTDASLAADARKVPVAVATICQVNRSIARDNLGRSYTAAEIAAFKAAGSKCVLSPANV